MPLPPHLGAEDAVLVEMHTDTSFDLPDGTLFLPTGTRLIGTWSGEQPGDSSAYAVVVGDVTWHFPIEHATVSLLPKGVLPWQEQARFAQESLAFAQEQEREEHDAEAARLYAQALVELEASGKSPVDLADVRHKRALCLRKVGNASEALLEFERFARAHEADAFAPGSLEVDRNAVELAAWGYKSMGDIILHDTEDREATLWQQLDLVARRLRILLKYLARRYDTKVEMLLTVAEIELARGNKSEAGDLFDQAVELSQRQRLGSPTGTDGVSLHLARLQKTLGVKKHRPGSAHRGTTRKKRPSGKSGTK